VAISANSSAVFYPSLATVDNPKPPIFNLNPTGLVKGGIGGGKPSSDESDSESWTFF
jgi:hypothetical protein